MRTIIKVSLNDEGERHDQSYWSYKSYEDELKALPRDLGDKLTALYSEVNGNDDGIIYNYDHADAENTYKIAYKSCQKINGYAGFSIVSFFNDKDKFNPFKETRAVDFIDCVPQWIVDKLTKKDLCENMPYPEKNWLKRNTERKVIKICDLTLNDKKKVAVFVDNLLNFISSAEDEEKGKCFGIVTDTKGLEGAQAVLKVALGLLPVKLSNRISFNFNSGKSVNGLNLFCTTLEEKSLFESLPTIVSDEYIEDYKFSNSYAEFLQDADNEIYKLVNAPKISETDDILEIVKNLNEGVKYNLLQKRCESEIAHEKETLDAIQSLYDECSELYEEKISEDKEIKIAFTRVAYEIFFSKDYFKIPDMNRTFFHTFLNVYKKDLKYNDVWKSDEGLKINISKICEDRKPEKILKYLTFLWGTKSEDGQNGKPADRENGKFELFGKVQEVIEKFFFSSRDGDSEAMQEGFKLFWDKFDLEKLVKFFSKCDRFYSDEKIVAYLKERFKSVEERIGFYKKYLGSNHKVDSELLESFISGEEFKSLDSFEDINELYEYETNADDLHKYFCGIFENYVKSYDDDMFNAEWRTIERLENKLYGKRYKSDKQQELDVRLSERKDNEEFESKKDSLKKRIAKFDASLPNDKSNKKSVDRIAYVNERLTERKSGKTGTQDDIGGRPINMFIAYLGYCILILFFGLLNSKLIFPVLSLIGLSTDLIAHKNLVETIYLGGMLVVCLICQVIYLRKAYYSGSSNNVGNSAVGLFKDCARSFAIFMILAILYWTIFYFGILFAISVFAL